MNVLAIIVTYNFTAWMDRCLGSLLASDPQPDIMVIDNNSQDGTPAIIRERYPQVILLENHCNLGFGHANNQGMNYALEHNYDGVLLINQDAWLVNNDTLRKLVDASLHHPDYGIISPIHLTGTGDAVEHGFSVYSGLKDMNATFPTDIVKVPFINAAIWYIPIVILKRVGMFDPLFYHYGEDKDMANRMSYHGLHIGFVPQTFGCHDREWRKTTRISFFRIERIYHLTEFANINHSFFGSFAFGVLASIKKSLLCLIHGKLYDSATYVKIALQLIVRTPAVMHARRRSIHVDLGNYQGSISS